MICWRGFRWSGGGSERPISVLDKLSTPSVGHGGPPASQLIQVNDYLGGMIRNTPERGPLLCELH